MAHTGPKPTFINNIITPMGRIIYPHLDKPSSASEGAEPRFGVTLLIPKDADVSAMKKALLECAVGAFGAEVTIVKDGKKVVRPRTLADFKHPFKDGDEKADALEAEEKNGDHYRGAVFIGPKSKRRPRIVDGKKQDLAPEEVYGGCYGRLVLSAMSYLTVEGKKPAVTFLLEIVQKVKDGDPVGGGGTRSTVDALPEDGPEGEDSGALG